MRCGIAGSYHLSWRPRNERRRQALSCVHFVLFHLRTREENQPETKGRNDPMLMSKYLYPRVVPQMVEYLNDGHHKVRDAVVVALEQDLSAFGANRIDEATMDKIVRHVQKTIDARRAQGERGPVHESWWGANAAPKTLAAKQVWLAVMVGAHAFTWRGGGRMEGWNVPCIVERVASWAETARMTSTAVGLGMTKAPRVGFGVKFVDGESDLRAEGDLQTKSGRVLSTAMMTLNAEGLWWEADGGLIRVATDYEVELARGDATYAPEAGSELVPGFARVGELKNMGTSMSAKS